MPSGSGLRSSSSSRVGARSGSRTAHHGDLPPGDLLEPAEAILLEVREAIRRGDQIATVHVNPNETFETSYVSVGPRKDGRHNGITRLSGE